MPFDHSQTNGGLLAGRESGKTNDPVVWRTPKHGHFAEVFVQSHKHTFFCVRLSKDFLVARVFRPLSRPDNVVPGRPDACVPPPIRMYRAGPSRLGPTDR